MVIAGFEQYQSFVSLQLHKKAKSGVVRLFRSNL